MAYKERVDMLFKLLDGNNNGTIEKADAQAVLKASLKILKAEQNYNEAQKADLQASISNFIEGAIKTGGGADKKVTEAEFLDIVEKHFIGKPFSSAPDWYKKSIGSLFGAIDRDNNGVISETEFVTFLTTSVPAVSPDLAKVVYQQAEGKLDKPAFQRAAWNWVTSKDNMPQDVILTFAIAALND